MNIARAVTYTSVPASDIHVLSYNCILPRRNQKGDTGRMPGVLYAHPHTRSCVSNMVQRPANDQQRSKEGGFFYGGSRSHAAARSRVFSMESRQSHFCISRYHLVASCGFLSNPQSPCAFARPSRPHACSDPSTAPIRIPIMAIPRILLRSTPCPFM